MQTPETKPQQAWHSLESHDALAALESRENGLSAAEAARRLARYGPNRLAERKGRSALARLRAQFDNLLIIVLLMAGVASAALEHWVDSAVIFAVVIVNAAIGYIQEGRAERALEAIKGLLAPHAVVMRDGRRHEVDIASLVPGDIVLLRSGDRVPADLRLLHCHGFAVQEAALTGESLPVEKSAKAVAAGTPLAERSNMVYGGTLVVQGQAAGVVAETAAHTELGRVSRLVAETETLTTPLLRQMSRFGRTLTLAILTLAAAAILIAVFVHGTPATQAFMAAVGLAVAAIPEGLPAILSITLAIGVIRMARRQAVIRRLPAVETLGAVSVICSDKTGTLTRNELIVEDLIGAAGAWRITGASLGAPGAITKNETPLTGADDPDLGMALAIAAQCNDASLHEDEHGWTTSGSPVDGALLALAHKGGAEIETLRDAHPRLDAVPFESDHKYMATLHDTDAGGRIVYLKGAPERVLEMCSSQLVNGEVAPIDIDHWHARTHALADRGQRVLALAYREIPAALDRLRHEDVAGGLVMVALAGVADPPRIEVPAAIAQCRSAGIGVKIITGDHPATAATVARAVGLGETPKVLSGAALDELGPTGFAAAARETDVFARTTPEHKIRIVKALQAEGAIVAMTGDGVNDAPALKRADIGVAMGKRGTEAAKEASGMVLLDDNFASIVHAVEEGRTVYDNLTKSILFLLPTNTGEALMVTLAMLLGFTMPITPVQILWVNTITAITLSLAFAFERAEADIMRRRPRARDAPLFSGFLAWRLVLVSAILLAAGLGMFFWAAGRGDGLEVARTMVVNFFVLCEMVYLLNVRRIAAPAWSGPGLWLNPVGFAALVAVALMQLVFTHLPEANAVFGSAPLDALHWGVVLAAGAVLFALVEIEKLALRRFRARAIR